MAKIINTHELEPDSLHGEELYQIYNGLDCALTSEIFSVLKPRLDNLTAASYERSRRMQGPALAMMRRGFRVDQWERAKGIEATQSKFDRMSMMVDRMAEAVWGQGLNPSSPQQLQDFFYGAMGITPILQRNKQTGIKSPTTNREALEKIKEIHFYAQPIINAILAARDAKKTLGVLKTGIDPDGRFRASFNIGGTSTFRWSSSKNAFGTGSNLQNITDRLRRMFVADPGKKIGYADLGQAESRLVAYLSGDENYITACESGDLHTTVTKMAWKDLPWANELKRDKALAEQKFYRDKSRRDLSKALGHGSNYLGQPFTMARHAKLEVHVAEEFQDAYFRAFPGIPRWHQRVATELQTTGQIVTPTGRRRQFFGRLTDDSTIRVAVAFGPQCSIADILNEAMYGCWSELEVPGIGGFELLAQVHDAIVFQYDEEAEAEILPRILSIMSRPWEINGRTLIIPSDCAVGWNWGKRIQKKDGTIENPYGVMTWEGEDNRERPPANFLDRVFS